MKQNRALPDWCRILDWLNSEIAKERTQNIEGHREMHNRKTQLEDKGGVDASLQAITSAPTTAVSTHKEKVVLSNE